MSAEENGWAAEKGRTRGHVLFNGKKNAVQTELIFVLTIFVQFTVYYHRPTVQFKQEA